MDLVTAFGLAVPAGLNAYVPLLAIALAQRAGLMHLYKPFDLLGAWWAIALIVVLLVVELFADKIPAVDHANDMIQSIVRPAAGGIAFAAASGRVGHADPALMILAGIILAGGVHAIKATSRPVVHAATVGTGGPVVSAVEDIAATISSVLAIVAPILAVIFIAACAYLAYRVIRAGWRIVKGGPDTGPREQGE